MPLSPIGETPPAPSAASAEGVVVQRFPPVAVLYGRGGWLDEHALARTSLTAAQRRALLSRGLLTDALATVFGEAVSVQRVGHCAVDAPGFGAAVRRDVIIRAGTQVCAIASTLMPQAVVRAHPWLDALGNRALGETLRARLAVERDAYEFRDLARDDDVGAAAWARRYGFTLPQGSLLVTELFTAEVLARLGAGLRDD